jgi:hypothetical protein
MHRHVRTLAIVFAGSLLVFSGVANGQRPETDAAQAEVTWKAAPGQILDSGASAGAQVAKDAETGRLRAARPGELPDSPIGRATQIIEYPGGAKLAIAGDDLMNHSVAVAVRNADGSVTVQVGHSTDTKTQLEVK